jgi:protoporphyrinogen IX oxidase
LCDDSIKAFRPGRWPGLFFATLWLRWLRQRSVLRTASAARVAACPRLSARRRSERQHNRLMLWIKAFHIVFVAAWFAGLFYLPRILVNLAMVPKDSHAERERLLLMGRKLNRFSILLAVPALGLGLWLLLLNWSGYLHGQGWMHAKLLLVAGVIGYHHACARLLHGFELLQNRRSHRWFRVFNEVSVLLFAAIVVLVVVKPF